MCGHVLFGRPASGFTSRTDRFCYFVIRVRPPQEVRQAENGRACAFWQTSCRRREQN